MPPILDAAIGLIFIYLLFSLVVTATKEVLISFTSSSWDGRAAMLQRGISEMVGQGFAQRFYEHPLVQSLSPKPKSLPNYIPQETFISTILDLIKPEGAEGTHGDLLAGIKDLKSCPLLTSLEAGKRDLELKRKSDKAKKSLVSQIKQIDDLIKSLGAAAGGSSGTVNDGLRRILLSIWADSDGKIDQFKVNLGAWFDRSMVRLTGDYKKRSQKFLLVIALIFAGICNVDTLHIVDVLSTDPKLREAIVQSATDYVNRTSTSLGGKLLDARSRLEAAKAVESRESDKAKQAEITKAVELLDKEVATAEKAWTSEVARLADALKKADGDAVTAEKDADEAENRAKIKAPPSPDSSAAKQPTAEELSKAAETKRKQATKLRQIAEDRKLDLAAANSFGGSEPTARLASTVRQMNGFGLPIGWTKGDCEKFGGLTVVGWLITALAASLGAPFWFDTLNKIVTIRAGGRAPEEKNPGENGKDDKSK